MSPLWWSASLGKLEKHTTYVDWCDIALYLLSLLIKGASYTDLAACWYRCCTRINLTKKCINYIYYLCKGNVTRYQMPVNSRIFPKLNISYDTPLDSWTSVQLSLSVMGNYLTSVVGCLYNWPFHSNRIGGRSVNVNPFCMMSW